MTHHPLITGSLLAIAVAIAILSAFAASVMRDAFQRIHYSVPIVSLSIGLIAIAVWIEDTDPQARIKVLLIGVILLIMNSILTHATAKAFYIRTQHHFEPLAEDHVPVVGRDRPAEEAGSQKEGSIE